MGIALPQLAPASEDRVSGGQVIKGALKFDDPGQTELRRTLGASTKFTLSFWYKPTILTSRDEFFDTSASTGFYLYRHSDGKIKVNTNSSGIFVGLGVYRDPNAFYHVVFQGTGTGLRLYVNGVLDSANNGTSALYAGDATISSDHATDSADYLLSQFYYIDGTCLGPNHFGFTDPLTGTWRPKKFKEGGTTVNNGTTWSSDYSGSQPTAAFDGTGPRQDGYAHSGSALTINFPSPGLSGRIIVYGGTGGGSPSQDSFTLSDGSVLYSDIVYTQAPYYSVLDFGEKENITSLTCSAGYCLYGISVDGDMLRDGETQNIAFGSGGFYLPFDGQSPIGEDKSGNGNDWKPQGFGGSLPFDSSNATGPRPILNNLGGVVARPGVFGSEVGFYETVSSSSGNPNPYIFDGRGTQPTLNFIRGATYTFDFSAAPTHPLRFATAADAAGSTEYTDGTSISGNIIKFTVPHNAPDTLYYYCANHGGMGNSISVTTDETKADKYASSLVLACPYAGDKEDVSGEINCTVSNKGSDNYGSIDKAIPGTLYQNGRFFDGSDDNINYSSSSSLSFPNAFTIEMYATPTSITDGAPISSKGYYYQNGNWYLKFTTQSGGKIQFYSYSPGTSNGQTNDITGTGTVDTNRLYHIVCQRDSSNLMSFMIDGVLVGQGSNVTHNLDDGGSNGVTVGRMAQNGSSNAAHVWYGGYISDLRIYKGITKYDVSGKSAGDQIFISRSTNPDILPNTPSGTTTRTTLSKVTDGAVAFDGTRGDPLNTRVSSSDFTFGTDDFTIEMFLYNEETAGKGFIQFSGDAGGLKATSSGVVTIHKDAGQNGVFRAYAKNTSTAFTTKVPYKQWCHVALTRESGTIKLFVDGKQDATTITSDTTNYATTYVAIGGYYDTNYLSKCIISNVRVNKGTAVYTKDFTPPSTKLTNISGTKLLCCQSNTVAGSATVSPNISGSVNTGTVWSQGSFLGEIEDARPWSFGFDGDLTVFTRPENNKMAAIVFDTPIAFSSKFEIKGSLDSGSTGSVEVLDGTNAWINVTSSFGHTSTVADYPKVNLTGSLTSPVKGIRFNGIYGSSAQPRFTGVYVDDTLLVDPIKKAGKTKESDFNPFNTDINTVRGREGLYATLDPLDHRLFTNGPSYVLSDGNLTCDVTGGNANASKSRGLFSSNMEIPLGKKIYCEFYHSYMYNDDYALGITSQLVRGYYETGGNAKPGAYMVRSNGIVYTPVEQLGSSTARAFTTGDLIGMAVDLESAYRTITWYKNGIEIYKYQIDIDQGPFKFSAGTDPGSNVATYKIHVNFGQKPFKYTPPEGFQALTSSIVRPDIAVSRPDKFVKATTYFGTNATRSVDVGFKPDLIWVKDRDDSNNHNNNLIDSVNGAPNLWMSDNPTALVTDSTDGLTAITTDGFTLGANTAGTQSYELNKAGNGYITWTWKAGGNKGTFNIDDADMGSAANAKMSVGSLNDVAFNKASLWRNNWTASGDGFGSNPVSQIFDATLSNFCNNNAGGQVVTWNMTSYSLSGKFRVRCSGTSYYIYVNGQYRARPPATADWIDLGNFSANGLYELQFAGSSYNTNTDLGSAGINIYEIEVDGKTLIDSDVSINSPTIAATACSVGTKQGFSIIKYAGGGSGSANSDSNKGVPHGLREAPDFLIGKNLNTTNAPMVYHSGLPLGTMNLSALTGNDTSSFIWAKRRPSKHEVFLGNNPEINGGNNYILYCWQNVPGLQKFGTYDGIDGSNGPVIDLGFRPRILLLKRYSSDHANAGWHWYDTARDTVNPAYKFILADKPYTERRAANNSSHVSTYYVDFLANGFKLRHDSTNLSVAGEKYLYAAWAETPAFNLFGAQSNAR